MRRLNINQILAIVIGVFSIVYLIGAFGIRSFPIPRPIDSDLFPKVLGGALFVLAVLLFLQKPREADFISIEIDPRLPKWRHPWVMVGLTVIAIGIYAAVLRPLGFVLASSALVIILSSYYGYSRWVVLVPTAIAVPLVLYLVLTRLMAINMPRGILPI